MDITMTVVETEVKNGLFAGWTPSYAAATSVTVNGKTINGLGEHVDQEVAEALAVVDLKNNYRLAFPPVKTVVVKTLSVDFDA